MNNFSFTASLLSMTSLVLLIAVILAILAVRGWRSYVDTRRRLREITKAFVEMSTEVSAESRNHFRKLDGAEVDFLLNGEPVEVKWQEPQHLVTRRGPRSPILNITEPIVKWLDARRMVRREGWFGGPDRNLRAAERNIALAVIFLPPGQRDRYREEWAAEMHALDGQDAAAFALRVLLRAPRAGLTLLLSRVFGRTRA
ncbi:hypothetical protein ACH475_14000 [Streptomyces globisporus]|uniref:hypothetical protein n=1 Tax=Streptomyces TaxID=1883 RepID=UPI000BEF767F|nr:hypothetical protein [Streptomyces sp. st170]WSV94049.1 hypothetical protein OG449_34425 [Streptomyces globisporus]